MVFGVPADRLFDQFFRHFFQTRNWNLKSDDFLSGIGANANALQLRLFVVRDEERLDDVPNVQNRAGQYVISPRSAPIVANLTKNF
jgi:hypothetical protein